MCHCEGYFPEAISFEMSRGIASDTTLALRLTERGLNNLERKLHNEALRLDMRIDKAYRRARFYKLGF